MTTARRELPKVQHKMPMPTINWHAARAYYLALPMDVRTKQAVADRFGVTRGRVSQIAKRDGWDDDVAELERIEAEETRLAVVKYVRREARARAERLSRTLEIYDRANDLALEMMPLTKDGELDIEALRKAGLPKLDTLLERLPGLQRMTLLALGEATDNIAIASVQPILVAFARIAIMAAPTDRRGDVYRELEEASGGLVDIDLG